jgi:hypothetical protein
MHLPPQPPRREVPPDLRVLTRQIGNGRDGNKQTGSAVSCSVLDPAAFFALHFCDERNRSVQRDVCKTGGAAAADEWASPHSWNPRHQHLCFKSYAHVNHEFAKAPPPRVQDRTAEGLQDAESWAVWAVWVVWVVRQVCMQPNAKELVRGACACAPPCCTCYTLTKGALHWTV